MLTVRESLKLRISNSARMPPGTVPTWHLKKIEKGAWLQSRNPIIFCALNANSSKNAKATNFKFGRHTEIVPTWPSYNLTELLPLLLLSEISRYVLCPMLYLYIKHYTLWRYNVWSYLLLLSGIVARRCRADADCIINDVTQLLNPNAEDADDATLRSQYYISSSLTVYTAHIARSTVPLWRCVLL